MHDLVIYNEIQSFNFESDLFSTGNFSHEGVWQKDGQGFLWENFDTNIDFPSGD